MGSVSLEGFGRRGGLNFKVVAGLTQPGSATENTIWVMAETMTGWIFSASEPAEPVEGIVWISTGTGSPVEFNALKKNTVMVYPLTAKQRINGAWVDVTAMSYQGGVWLDWIIWFYKNGDEYVSLTGGWVLSSTGEKLSNGIRIGSTSKENKTQKRAYTADAVELTGINSIMVHFSEYYLHSTSAMLEIEICDADGNIVASATVASGSGDGADVSQTVDVSAFNGEYTIRISLTYSTSSGTAYVHYAIFDEVSSAL